MYRILKFKEYCMTRDIVLLNKKTKKKDVCFDGETFFNEVFNFLETKKEYEAKIILLFCEKVSSGRRFQVINKIQIEGKNFWVLKDNVGNIYYMQCQDLNLVVGEAYYLDYGRKELLEIDGKLNLKFIEES